MCQPCFLVCPDSRGVADLFSGVYSNAVCPPCFLISSECFLVHIECRGVSALFSGLSEKNGIALFSTVSRVFSSVSSVS